MSQGDIIQEHGSSLTSHLCDRFLEIFDVDKNGIVGGGGGNAYMHTQAVLSLCYMFLGLFLSTVYV
jgi:hypothetical protein